jgi:hypothetical protein
VIFTFQLTVEENTVLIQDGCDLRGAFEIFSSNFYEYFWLNEKEVGLCSPGKIFNAIVNTTQKVRGRILVKFSFDIIVLKRLNTSDPADHLRQLCLMVLAVANPLYRL